MSGDNLKFLMTWPEPEGEVVRVTTANLAVKVGQRTIWPVDGADGIALEIQVDDLLSYLVEFWKPLILRQTYPISTQPERPSLLRPEAEKRWGTEPEETVEREDAQVTAFEDAHDLSRCFAGMFGLPPLWLVRQDDRMLIETRGSLRSVAFSCARASLDELGNEIADHLRATQNDRWDDLLEAWQTRDQGTPAVLLAWATSLAPDVAETFEKDGILNAPRNVSDAANDNDELRIAARMASALPEEQVRQIISLVASFEKSPAQPLDDLGAEVRNYIINSFADKRPFEQGEAAANFVRAHLQLNGADEINIFDVVEKLGVAVHTQRVEPATLFGLAVWGPRHGPAALLNELAMQHQPQIPVRENWVARVNLAHELCHLLLDHEHTLTAIEVLQSRMSVNIERRAKAFAGEFLLPAGRAAERWEAAKRPRSIAELDELVGGLCREFGVTKSVAAWKLEHGVHKHGVDLRALLDAVAPFR